MSGRPAYLYPRLLIRIQTFSAAIYSLALHGVASGVGSASKRIVTMIAIGLSASIVPP